MCAERTQTHTVLHNDVDQIDLCIRDQPIGSLLRSYELIKDPALPQANSSSGQDGSMDAYYTALELHLCAPSSMLFLCESDLILASMER